MAYRIMYWRPGMAAFKEYRDSVGRNVSILFIYHIILQSIRCSECCVDNCYIILLYR